MNALHFLPISVNITGRQIILIGGGKVAFHKAAILSRFTGRVRVVAPEFHPGFAGLPFELKQKTYAPEDLDNTFLVYICTENKTLNATIKAECEKRGILAGVCDDPALCDFVSPAIYQDGPMTVAVSSDAQDVRRSIRVRDRIKTLVEEGLISIR
ncbi:MAG: bifunctional precorrin-2 dehydrogenase/sirohydrochlorin ferrochelatase [Tannerella sp.]|jgi:siroheme synthase-like protein|nr:bifunctional precorrin-2 dehydrogenase/sirohydrochlorin ferrochelatase [Tannerella sp.]